MLFGPKIVINIKMAEIKKRKRIPTVCLPSSVEKSKHTGNLYGYYIESTNYYNVVSTELIDGFTDATIIGKIIEKNGVQANRRSTWFFDNEQLVFIDPEGKQCKIENTP